MNRVINLYNKTKKYPFGKRFFSYMVSRQAPYFLSVKPQVEELRPNFIKVNMRKRRALHNHLKTVHAIAMCNLCEYAMGICAEASIPAHRRWIPMGMEVAYLKKATTNLTACNLRFELRQLGRKRSALFCISERYQRGGSDDCYDYFESNRQATEKIAGLVLW